MTLHIVSKKRLLYVLLIALIGTLVYSNSFNVPFVFDDDYYVIGNPLVKKLDYYFNPSAADQFRHYVQYREFKTRFIGFLTLALDYKRSGLNPRSYHFINLATHIANAILIFFLIVSLKRTPLFRDSDIDKTTFELIAFFSSAIFVSHPVQTQAVTYISQRFTSMVTLFYLMSVFFYTLSRLEQNRRARLVYYLSAMISTVLAMKTKEVAFTIPLSLLLMEISFFGKFKQDRIKYLSPFLITLLIIPATLYSIGAHSGNFLDNISLVTRSQTEATRLDYLFTQSRVLVTYIKILFLPVGLHLDYNVSLSRSILDPQVIVSALSLMLLMWAGIYMFIKSGKVNGLSRIVSFGVFWFFITLSVESSLIPIIDVLFEHRVYLPSAFFIPALISGFFVLTDAIKTRKVLIRLVVLGAVVVVLGVLAYNQNKVWLSSIALWENSARYSPAKYRNHNNLGVAYMENGMLDKAMEQFEIAYRIEPNHARLHLNIGKILEADGKIDDAIKSYRKALKIEPGTQEAYNAIAQAYLLKGSPDKAIGILLESLKLNPFSEEASRLIGDAYFIKTEYDTAIKYYQKAVDLLPGSLEAKNKLELAYIKKDLLKNSSRIGNRSSPKN